MRAAVVALLCAAIAWPAGAAVDASSAAAQVTAQTNTLRQAAGAAPLQPAPKLQAAAQAFADYMARTGRYGHDADGRKARQRVQAQGYAACIVAENIAYYFNSQPVDTSVLAREFYDGWRQSPGHRRNMLDAQLRDTGLGIAQSKRTGRWYAVQLFGLPRDAKGRCGRPQMA